MLVKSGVSQIVVKLTTIFIDFLQLDLEQVRLQNISKSKLLPFVVVRTLHYVFWKIPYLAA